MNYDLTFSSWLIVDEQNNAVQNLTPIKKIGSGHFASVYSTENPDIIIRIEPVNAISSCEKIMSNPKLQSTNGVAKIYDHSIKTGQELFPNDLNQKDKKFLVTYKEKVRTNWYDEFSKKYESKLRSLYDVEKILSLMPYGEETAKKYGSISAFIQLALEKFRDKNTIIDFLSLFDQDTKGLIKAIRMGLPFDDLHTDNLGLNSKGNLVVIDC